MLICSPLALAPRLALGLALAIAVGITLGTGDARGQSRSKSPPPPSFDAVKQPLCEAYKLGPKDCKASSFETPRAIDIDGDKKPEWIYVPRKGPELCFVRAACFVVARRGKRGWQIILDSMASSIKLHGAGKRGQVRDLVTVTGDSADRARVVRYRWAGGSYKSAQSVSCPHDERSAQKVSASVKSLCSAVKGGIPLQ